MKKLFTTAGLIFLGCTFFIKAELPKKYEDNYLSLKNTVENLVATSVEDTVKRESLAKEVEASIAVEVKSLDEYVVAEAEEADNAKAIIESYSMVWSTLDNWKKGA